MDRVSRRRKEWRPSTVERSLRQVARFRAIRQLLRVTWDRFQKARLEYLEWEAFSLWVRAILETERRAPAWLSTILRKRCPEFLEYKKQFSETRPSQVSRLTLHLFEWIHNDIFADARRNGWLDAVIFYAVRNPRSQRTWAYWEHCERQWKHRRPTSYPSFEQWRRAASKWSISNRIDAKGIANAVARHLEWKALTYWIRPLCEASAEIPQHVVGELERRYPGLLDLMKSHQRKDRRGENLVWRRLVKWGEVDLFRHAKREGQIEAVLEQARADPHIARIIEYSERWTESWSQNPRMPYPSFEEWCRAADNYVENKPN